MFNECAGFLLSRRAWGGGGRGRAPARGERVCALGALRFGSCSIFPFFQKRTRGASGGRRPPAAVPCRATLGSRGWVSMVGGGSRVWGSRGCRLLGRWSFFQPIGGQRPILHKNCRICGFRGVGEVRSLPEPEEFGALSVGWSGRCHFGFEARWLLVGFSFAFRRPRVGAPE